MQNGKHGFGAIYDELKSLRASAAEADRLRAEKEHYLRILGAIRTGLLELDAAPAPELEPSQEKVLAALTDVAKKRKPMRYKSLEARESARANAAKARTAKAREARKRKAEERKAAEAAGRNQLMHKTLVIMAALVILIMDRMRHKFQLCHFG